MLKKLWTVIFFELIIFIMLVGHSMTTPASTVVRDGNLRIEVVRDHGDTVLKFSDGRSHRYDFDGKVKVVPSNKLTAKMLRSRRNKVIYIEKITSKPIDKQWGVVINKKAGRWRVTNNKICYKSSGIRVNRGNTVHTYCVYNPYTQWLDDIDERYDVVAK